MSIVSKFVSGKTSVVLENGNTYDILDIKQNGEIYTLELKLQGGNLTCSLPYASNGFVPFDLGVKCMNIVSYN